MVAVMKFFFVYPIRSIRCSQPEALQALKTRQVHLGPWGTLELLRWVFFFAQTTGV